MERLTDKYRNLCISCELSIDDECDLLNQGKFCANAKRYHRLAQIEDILGDDYDLDRLRELMNQRMTMRDDVAERMKLVDGIPMDRLRELVDAERDGRCFITLPYGEEEGPSENDPVGPEGEPGVLDSKWYKRAGELIEADRDGRCVVLLSNDDVYTIRGDIVNGIIKANCRDACKPPKSALKGDQHG